MLVAATAFASHAAAGGEPYAAPLSGGKLSFVGGGVGDEMAGDRVGEAALLHVLELRVVEDNDPHNPDVQYNNGHLMVNLQPF